MASPRRRKPESGSEQELGDSPLPLNPGEVEVVETRDGRVAFWSAGAERIYGHSAADVLSQKAAMLYPGTLALLWKKTAARVLAGESIQEHRTVHVTRDGRHINVKLDVSPVIDDSEGITGLRWVLVEAAERRRTHQMLRESDAWARSIVEAAVDGIVTINEFGIIEYMNPAAELMFGYKREEALGQSIQILMAGAEGEQVEQYLDDYRAKGMMGVLSVGRETIAQRKDGSTFPAEVSVSGTCVEGRLVLTGTVHDITERKKTETEKNLLLRDLNKRNIEMTYLHAVEETFRSRDTVADVCRDLARLMPSAFMFPEFTRARITIDGDVYDVEPFDDTPWLLECPVEAAGRVRGKVQVFLLERAPAGGGDVFLPEERNLLSVTAGALSVTLERREAEARVIMASKLASIGELAAGVGHEINNPLNGIINCAEILSSRFEEGSENYHFAELIKSEADRIAKIVKSLLTFSRQDREHHSPARLCDIVDAVLSLSRKKIAKSHVHLKVNVPEDLPRVECRSEQMQQVVMNLIINSLHALDEKYPKSDPDKRLSIFAHAVYGEQERFLRLTVEDHGVGIAPVNMSRLFDPFFTTKGRDVGTGLGLSVSDGIVKAMGGRIVVESELGSFARFHVDLPLGDTGQPGNGDKT